MNLSHQFTLSLEGPTLPVPSYEGSLEGPRHRRLDLLHSGVFSLQTSNLQRDYPARIVILNERSEAQDLPFNPISALQSPVPRHPTSVLSKALTRNLTCLESTHLKNRGEGSAIVTAPNSALQCLTSAFSQRSELFCPMKVATHFFSSNSELLYQKHPGAGYHPPRPFILHRTCHFLRSRFCLQRCLPQFSASFPRDFRGSVRRFFHESPVTNHQSRFSPLRCLALRRSEVVAQTHIRN